MVSSVAICSLDVTARVRWFLTTLLNSLQEALQRMDRVLAKARFRQQHQHRGLLAEQIKVLNRLLDGGERGFEDGISAAKYQAVAKVSKATAARHLADLLDNGCIERLSAEVAARATKPSPSTPHRVLAIHCRRILLQQLTNDPERHRPEILEPVQFAAPRRHLPRRPCRLDTRDSCSGREAASAVSTNTSWKYVHETTAGAGQDVTVHALPDGSRYSILRRDGARPCWQLPIGPAPASSGATLLTGCQGVPGESGLTMRLTKNIVSGGRHAAQHKS
jgi:hypothetical protein